MALQMNKPIPMGAQDAFVIIETESRPTAERAGLDAAEAGGHDCSCTGRSRAPSRAGSDETMNETNLAVVLEMQDNASPQLRAFGEQVKATAGNVKTAGGTMNTTMGGVDQTLAKNKMALRELASGVMYLGGTFLALGVAMSSSNNETVKSIGNTVMMVGAFMTAIGSSVQFIAAIGKMIHALKALQIQQILTQASVGTGRMGDVGGRAAIAGGVVYGVSKYSSAQTKAATGATNINVTQNIAGSVVTERQLTDNVHKGLLLKGQRNGTTGVK